MTIRARMKANSLIPPRTGHSRAISNLRAARNFTTSVRPRASDGDVPQPSSAGASITSSTHLPPGSAVFSGIQPTGMPHLGNYLGALRQWVKIQDEAPQDARLIFSIVDLHAITAPPRDGHGKGEWGAGGGGAAGTLRRYKREALAVLMAVGLSEERCTLFWQSDVPAHSELMWILSCQASTGMLSRMTQWKDKSAKEGAPNQRLGLFSYPVLQAADVLVHGATHVPVGEDQSQHLEFARYTARAFNNAYPLSPSSSPPVLREPTTILSPHKRIMSLTTPTSKMSKSDPQGAKSRISVISSPEHIRKSIRSALTDMQSDRISYDPETRPGVSNLLDIFNSFDKEARTPEVLAEEIEDIRTLKHETAEAVVQGLAGVREKYLDIMERENRKYVDRVAAEGAEKARKSADETMRKVREAVGLGGKCP
ncbi:hypothetical protein MKZ38_006037 [Zalerion maritima]|uniref:tryptophan--tRNA ligase n=1 Tax=Zalerion maritima TaxID=339359 RepID=A0AAD5RJC8_9PEZI|nr:hypothetical protein MKZ38_006037 [Zalerion maritima]